MKASRAWFILLALLLLTGVANAGRKRIVVLELEGENAEKFHADLIKLIKKSHTVVSADKWNGTAEEMSATKLTDKNVKKVARKLKVDGVVSGSVQKRRDEYILRLKLRSGVSGELVGGQINIKSGSTKLDGTAAKDVKDELIEVIADLESNRAGGGSDDEEEEEKPKKGFVKKPAADEEEEKPKKGAVAKKPAVDEEEEKPKKGAVAKKPAADEEEEKPKKGAVAKKPAVDEEVAVALKPKKDVEKPKKPVKSDEEEDEKEDEKKDEKKDDERRKPKKVAVKDDEEGEEGEEGEGIEGGADVSPMDADSIYSPGERAVDAAVGMSFTARRMAFAFDPAKVTQTPAGYKQYAPVPGAYLDATLYPLAFGHKRKDILRHLGATVMFDRVLAINSRNPNDGMKLKSTEQRYAIGVAFRYPLGTGAKAPVVGAALRYGRQQFTIDGMAAIPNVNYTLIDFTGFFHYTIAPKLLLNFNLGALLPTDAGAITKIAQYGRAKITGLEGSAGLDYLLTKNIFARGEARLETLGYAFLGEGDKGDGVAGARDTYFGGALTIGFLY